MVICIVLSSESRLSGPFARQRVNGCSHERILDDPQPLFRKSRLTDGNESKQPARNTDCNR